MGNDQLPYMNLAELVLQVHKAVAALETNCDIRDELYDIADTQAVVTFLVGLGQADSARALAEFNKISKDLALRTLSRFADTHKCLIEHVLSVAKDYEA